MPKISLINICFGFFLIFCASMGGFFLGQETKEIISQNSLDLLKWEILIYKSAHAHTNLFGMLHILFGITIPYSKLSLTFKKLQTLGLMLGSLSMSVIMFFRAKINPYMDSDYGGAVMGVFLTLALLSIGVHCIGLTYKIIRN